MRLYTKVLTLAASAALFAAPIFAQGASTKVDVPFTFHVANQVLPAGSYEVKINPSTLLVLITGDAGKSVAMTIGYRGPAINGPEDAAVKFRVYGKTRFFAGVWTPALMDLTVGTSHLEREMAKAEKPTETALVVVPRHSAR